MSQASTNLPGLPEPTSRQLVVGGLAIAVAYALLMANGARVVARVELLSWWPPVVFLVGMAAADFLSGIIHWAADTWGRDDWPLVGPRLLVPFRLHHINPDDFLRRRFADTNGDVSFLWSPVMAGALAFPIETGPGRVVSVFLLGFCGLGMMTNQIHQWAHMPHPPRLVSLLQDCGLILSHGEHARHHAHPYDAGYCIATGWCNRPLEQVLFFRRLERIVARLTGLEPREDDARYALQFSGDRPESDEGPRLA